MRVNAEFGALDAGALAWWRLTAAASCEYTV